MHISPLPLKTQGIYLKKSESLHLSIKLIRNKLG